jgi:hypothetical protein
MPVLDVIAQDDEKILLRHRKMCCRRAVDQVLGHVIPETLHKPRNI